MDLVSLRRAIEKLNGILEPIAARPVAFGPDLAQRLAELPNPLDEAEIRAETEEMLLAAIDLYGRSGDAERREIRQIFRTNPAFTWAAALPFPPDSEEQLRRHLLHFSIVDQGRDPRDALVWLDTLRKAPWYAALQAEAAGLSSDEDRFGFGSTRAMLRKRV